MENHNILKMIALFAVLLQIAVAKDIISENPSANTFTRIESGECVYLGSGVSAEYKFDEKEMTITSYTKDDCSGDKVSVTLPIESSSLKDCPEYVGFVGKDDVKDCKHEKYADRVYYKTGCGKSTTGSVKHVVEGGKLKTNKYKSTDCSGTPEVKEIGECDTCYNGAVGSEIVRCGAISQMILAILAVVFFLF